MQSVNRSLKGGVLVVALMQSVSLLAVEPPSKRYRSILSQPLAQTDDVSVDYKTQAGALMTTSPERISGRRWPNSNRPASEMMIPTSNNGSSEIHSI